MIDNVLWHGKVVDPLVNDARTVSIRKLMPIATKPTIIILFIGWFLWVLNLNCMDGFSGQIILRTGSSTLWVKVHYKK